MIRRHQRHRDELISAAQEQDISAHGSNQKKRRGWTALKNVARLVVLVSTFVLWSTAGPVLYTMRGKVLEDKLAPHLRDPNGGFEADEGKVVIESRGGKPNLSGALREQEPSRSTDIKTNTEPPPILPSVPNSAAGSPPEQLNNSALYGDKHQRIVFLAGPHKTGSTTMVRR